MNVPILRDMTDFSYTHIEDTGCEMSDSCLTCPLPMCRHDDEHWYSNYKALAKYKNIIDVLRTELTNETMVKRVYRLADENNIVPRTVWRLNKKIKEGKLDFVVLDLVHSKLHATVGSS